MMDDQEFHIYPEERSSRRGLAAMLKQWIFEEKLQNPLGILLLSACAVLFSTLIALSGATAVVLILAVIVGIPLVYAVVAYPKLGILVLVLGAYFIMWVYRMGLNFPLGTLMDALQVLLILGFFIKQKGSPNWSVFKQPIGIMVLIWVGYNIIQVANPVAESRLAWLYTIRSTALVMLMYFIFSVHIKSINFLKLLLKVWLCIALFAALYAFKQEYIGFFAFEERELADPRQRALLFINGHWRKFAIFSDPVAFSYNMVTASLFCFAMLFGPIKVWKKIILGIMILIFLQAMLFSGTRGAYVLLPAALALFVILNLNKKILLLSLTGGVFFALLIFMPSSSPSIQRFQSAFRPSEDASFNVRAENQKRIQPFIQTHPFGGGLGATGVWGARFSPHSFLANFPPDSGYVRVAVEVGSIGLFLICTLFVVILITGINNFYKIRDPELKIYCLAMILIIFAYAVGNYPQEAIVQFPSNIYFCLFAAMITITYRLDKQRHGPGKKETNSGLGGSNQDSVLKQFLS